MWAPSAQAATAPAAAHRPHGAARGPHRAHSSAAPAPAVVPVPVPAQPLALTPPPVTAVPAAAELDDERPAVGPAKRLAHDVPKGGQDEEEFEVPVDWVVKDGRMHHRAQALSLTLGLWPDALSFGAWYTLPVLPRGIIHHVNDSLDVEFGLMLAAMQSSYYWNDHSTSWQLWPAGGVRWNFFLTPRWTTFAAIKLAGRIGLSGAGPGWFDVIVGLGATYRIKDRVLLRLELNYPQGAVVGLSFPLGAL